MKCDKCGFIPNPGDQVCINCGAKLSLINAVVPELETVNVPDEKKSNKKLVIGAIIGIVVLIVAVFLIIKFVVMKG